MPSLKPQRIARGLTALLLLSTSALPFAQAQSDWTEWYNRDSPDATGDYETVSEFLKLGQACETPIDIECVDALTEEDYTTFGEVYACTPEQGGVCRNAEQPDGVCRDYKVRFDCGTLISAPEAVLPEAVPEAGLNPLVKGGLIGGGLVLLAWLGSAVLRRPGGAPKAPNPRNPPAAKLSAVSTAPPSVPNVEKTKRKPAQAGLIFPGSAMPAVSTTGGGAAGTLSSFSGGFAALMPANQATGRIGYAQNGVPKGEDVAFGTGFLISDRHILTNRHVVEAYRDAINKGGVGIEFYGERESDVTDFIPFDISQIDLPTGLDLAILTLAASPKDRAPIPVIPPAKSLEGREIAVIGYPDPASVTDDIKALVEDPAIFAVKRVSQGQIFRHSTDLDQIFGVEVPVGKMISETGKMQALCHNASTLGGSSGSPVLDLQTGELLGVHFGYDVAFSWAEPANFAIPITLIVEALKQKGLLS